MLEFLTKWCNPSTDEGETDEKVPTYQNYNYLKSRYNMTGTQFENLIGFLTVILNEDVMKLASMSPDYICEKFYRYIGDPNTIITTDKTKYGGIHEVLRRDFLEKYYNVWGNSDGWEFFINSEISTEDFIEDK